MHEFQTLRKLLIGDEIASIARIDETLSTLGEEIRDPGRVTERLGSLFDQILIHATLHERQKLKNALLLLCETLIDEEPDASYDRILSKLSPRIYALLRHEITVNRDAVSDLIYPVVGGMISKYVSQMIRDLLNDINEKIQTGLSMANLRRKVVAKIKGIPESELLLLESAPIKIKAVMLIHKQMGTVLASKIREDSNIGDPDMVGSMLTALRDFINHWIESHEHFSDIREINYGNSKIVLEASGHCYLALLVQGHPSSQLFNTTHQVLKTILSQHSTAIQQFSGDMRQIDNNAIVTAFEPLFVLRDRPETKKMPVSSWPVIVLALLLFGMMGSFWWWNAMKEHYRDAANAQLWQHPALALYKLHASWQNSRLHLQGNVPHEELKVLAWELVEALPNPHGFELNNDLLVIEPFRDDATLRHQVAALLALANRNPFTQITSTQQQGVLQISGQSDSKRLLEQLTTALATLPQVTQVTSSVILIDADDASTLYFDNNSDVLSPHAVEKIEAIAKELTLHPDLRLDVVGYSSQSGSLQKNMQISSERTQAVITLLRGMGVEPHRITGKSTPLPPYGTESNATQARCVKFYWYNFSDIKDTR